MKFHNKVYFAEKLIMYKITIIYLNARKSRESSRFPHMVQYETIISSTVI